MAVTPSRRKRRTPRMLAMLGLMCLFLFSAWSSPIKAEPGHNLPLAGFSFSPKLMRWAGYQPLPSLRLLLQQTQPDLVRLPIYWDSVAPNPGSMDFSESDELLDTVAQYNSARPSRRVREHHREPIDRDCGCPAGGLDPGRCAGPAPVA